MDNYRLLVDHDYWATSKLADKLEMMQEVPQKAVDIFEHIIAAQEIWISRIKGLSQPVKVWHENFGKEHYHTILTRIHESWKDILANDSLERVIEYTNTQGTKFSNPIHEILTHVSLHSQYHRGQVITLIHDKTDQLPALDMIVFLRESKSVF